MSFATDSQHFPAPAPDTAISPSEIADSIAELAKQVANCVALDARDRNTAIGQLRNVAAFLRGAEGLPGFRQAAFAPTTSGGPKGS
jgi:hypothetical protein